MRERVALHAYGAQGDPMAEPMKLSTTFWGDDLLFEGDLSLSLRVLPAGARITRAVATLAPAGSALRPGPLFEEVFPIDSNGRGPFGLLIQQEHAPVATVVALGARRSVQRLTVAGVGTTIANGAFVQIDMGGLWMGVDRSGNLTSATTADRRSYLRNPDGTLSLPGLTSERFRLSHANPATTTAIGVQQVTIRSYPSNLQLRLGDLGPVWFRLGDLRDPVTTPDFAAMLDAFLQRNEPQDGVYLVPLTLHSDSLARLRVSLALEYHLEQRLLPPQLSQAVFPYAYGALPEAAPVALEARLPLDARAIPGATRAELSGRFAASRVVHGSLRATTVADSVAIDAGQTLAHPIRLSAPTLVDAIDLHLEATTATARLLVTLQEDVGGKPWGPSLFSEPVKLELARPAAGGGRWASAPFATPFTFQPDTTYWLVVTAAEGEVQWAAAPVDGLALLRTRDAGLSYRQVRSERLNAPLAGIYRLRATPAQFRQPLKLTVAEHEVSLRDYDALGQVAFRLDLPAVAAAIDAALNDAARSQAVRGQRIVNGDFSAWTRHARRGRRDATPPLPLPLTPRTSLSVRPDGAMLYLGGAVVSPGNELPDVRIQAVVNSAPLRLGAHLPLRTVVDDAEITIDPLAIAVAPDGTLAYGVGLVSGSFTDFTNRPGLFRVDPRSGALLATVMPANLAMPDGPVFLAVDPAGRDLYLASRAPASAGTTTGAAVTLHRLPATFTAETTLEALPIAGAASSLDSMLIAPDGQRAYLAVDGRIELVDLERWQWLGSLPFSDKQRRLAGMALSPDGTRLYVLQARGTTPSVLEVVAFDTRRLETLLVRAGASQQVTPTIEPAAGSGMVGLNRLSQHSRSRDPLAPAVLGVALIDEHAQGIDPWLPMIATPDDSRLLVVSARRAHAEAPAHWQLHMIDTDSYRLHETIALAARPRDLAVTPDSRRAFVLTVSDAQLPAAQLQALELDAWSLDEWALTAGRATPVAAAGSAGLALRLGSPDADSALSQIVAIAGGQAYDLRFLARAAARGAEAELFWLDSTCGRLDQASIPLDPRSGAGLWPHLLRLTAPASAAWAELRFRVPIGNLALIDAVQLSAPPGATLNDDFAARVPAPDPGDPRRPLTRPDGSVVELPAGWSLSPADLSPDQIFAYVPPEIPGVIGIRPADGRPVVLSQRISLRAGEPLILTVQARPYGPPGAQPATVELRWQGSTAAPLHLVIDGQHFDTLSLGGNVPDGVSAAELLISQPPGGILLISRVALSQPETVSVPLGFLAETAGELAVIDPVVAYDTGPRPATGVRPPPEPAQPTPRCTPTPPGAIPAPPGGPPQPGPDLLAEPARAGYCPCCESLHVLAEPALVTSTCGMRGIAGTCPHSGTRVVIYG